MKSYIMPLTEFRQNITSLWKKIIEEDIVIIITVKGKPVCKVSKYDQEISLENVKNITIEKSKKANQNKKTDNFNKKWGGYKPNTNSINWDEIL